MENDNFDQKILSDFLDQDLNALSYQKDLSETDYNSSKFCELTVNSNSTLCQTFQNAFTHCSNTTNRNDIILRNFMPFEDFSLCYLRIFRYAI